MLTNISILDNTPRNAPKVPLSEVIAACASSTYPTTVPTPTVLTSLRASVIAVAAAATLDFGTHNKILIRPFPWGIFSVLRSSSITVID
jgi:hypothetical protein